MEGHDYERIHRLRPYLIRYHWCLSPSNSNICYQKSIWCIEGILRLGVLVASILFIVHHGRGNSDSWVLPTFLEVVVFQAAAETKATNHYLEASAVGIMRSSTTALKHQLVFSPCNNHNLDTDGWNSAASLHKSVLAPYFLVFILSFIEFLGSGSDSLWSYHNTWSRVILYNSRTKHKFLTKKASLRLFGHSGQSFNRGPVSCTLLFLLLLALGFYTLTRSYSRRSNEVFFIADGSSGNSSVCGTAPRRRRGSFACSDCSWPINSFWDRSDHQNIGRIS